MVIQSNHVTKRYKQRTVVNDVNLSVPKGQIFGLLGPNAAGKTTLIRILCGIIEADDGQVTIAGLHINKAKRSFGYVAQYFGQYEELSVWENLKFYASMYGVSDEAWLLSLLERYELIQFKHQKAGALSGGYKRRLALVCAMGHNPDVLFLDEPTAGIDPTTRKLLWDDFYRLSAEGKTLFVTTHYMEEAQRCHQLAFISAGKIVAQGSPDTIVDALGEAQVYAANIAYMPEIREKLLALKGMLLVNQFGNELRIVASETLPKHDIEAAINSVATQAYSLVLSKPNLEDVFIALTQEHSQ